MRVRGNIKKVQLSLGKEAVVGQVVFEFNSSKQHGALLELSELQEVEVLATFEPVQLPLVKIGGVDSSTRAGDH